MLWQARCLTELCISPASIALTINKHDTPKTQYADSKAHVAWPDEARPDLLIIKAHVIDTIFEVGEEFGIGEDGKLYCEWAELVLKLSSKFAEIDSLVSTFWRTCVKDCSIDGLHPAPSYCVTKFGLYFTMRAVRFYGSETPHEFDYDCIA